MIAIKQCKDGFVWALVSVDTAKTLVYENKTEVYRLYDDDSEGLIEDVSEIDPHASRGGQFGVELHLMKPITKNKKRIKEFFTRDGYPTELRIYDNGGSTFDRYTICFIGKVNGEYYALGASENPCSPLGFGQHSSTKTALDYPNGIHLGKLISFDTLPDAVREWVMTEYLEIHNFRK
jgi:hypothetical protein